MNNKKGISLIILITTMIVLSILITITVVNVDDSLDNANEIKFIEELNEIKRIVGENKGEKGIKINYKIQPTNDISVLSGKISDGKKAAFLNDIYIKQITGLIYELYVPGHQKHPEDYYYAEIGTLKVNRIIYLKGEKVGDKYIFTDNLGPLTFNPVGGAKTAKTYNVATRNLTNVVKKEHNWANSIAFKIEDLAVKKVKISNINESKSIEKDVINGEVVIDKSVMSKLGLKEKSLILEFNNEKQVIDVSNLDVNIENVTASVEKNKITLNLLDNQSGLKGYKYVVLTNGTPKTAEYVNTFGTEIGPEGVIEVKPGVNKVGVIAIDNAGNISNLKEVNVRG